MTLEELELAILFFYDRVDEGPDRVLPIVTAITIEVFGDDPRPENMEQAATLMNAAGVIINAASRISDDHGLRLGEEWMTRVVAGGLLQDTKFESAALYNLANSRLGITDLNMERAWRQAAGEDRLIASAEARFADRERLVKARCELTASASIAKDGRDQSLRLCNLANTLDHSGRWVEAYDAYVRALDADPTNGNAAGNAAVLIGKAVGAGWDFEGHLCSLYDHYLGIAHAHRDVTVAVAGEAAAQRFDELEPLGSHEPLAYTPDRPDPYQEWVARHRLALVAALEGLGQTQNQERWDTIALPSVVTTPESSGPPTIFGILNVLKADYLVARRLAFEADQAIEETGCWVQQPDDPGVYTETLNYAIYGEVASKLILAHRAALDVLDKTAVAVNEHLRIGDNPKGVAFRRYWTEGGNNPQLRSVLLQHDGLAPSVLAMAELALDMAPGGLYEHAQDVRNAGTHRFVLVHRGMRDIHTTATTQAITLDEMRETTLQSLTVARAAYIYLIALLATYEGTNQSAADRPVVPVFLPDA